MEENPYEPIASVETVQQPVTPHTSTIRTEAWRGFKFGAKITCVVTMVLMVDSFAYVAVASGGVPLKAIDYLDVAQGIGGILTAILLTSFYGGVAGGIIMALAAATPKRRRMRD